MLLGQEKKAVADSCRKLLDQEIKAVQLSTTKALAMLHLEKRAVADTSWKLLHQEEMEAALSFTTKRNMARAS